MVVFSRKVLGACCCVLPPRRFTRAKRHFRHLVKVDERAFGQTVKGLVVTRTNSIAPLPCKDLRPN